MHDHIARGVYYCSVHLLSASIVGTAAWLLTTILPASAATKCWIWVVTALNFVVPSGALIDKLWAPHLVWASPLGAIGSSIWDLTMGRGAIVLAVVWLVGAGLMGTRLFVRLRAECRRAPASGSVSPRGIPLRLRARGVPVSLHASHSTPSVRGLFRPEISLPSGVGRLLNQKELDAVLLHELGHVKRHDNLVRLVYELALCLLWFHPLVWLAGTRIALYRELACDDLVIRRARGRALVSALAKLAAPERAWFLRATASSHLSYRLTRLAGAPLLAHRRASVLLTSLFVGVLAAGAFETVAHTACCFVLKR